MAFTTPPAVSELALASFTASPGLAFGMRPITPPITAKKNSDLSDDQRDPTQMFIPTIFAPLIQNAILLLCGWSTFKVLETDRAEDDTHWLTFWFVYTLFAFAKSIVDYVGSIIPFYTEATLLFTVYLAYFGGATHMYGTFLKPLLKEHEKAIDKALAEAKAKAQEVAAQAGQAAANLKSE